MRRLNVVTTRRISRTRETPNFHEDHLRSAGSKRIVASAVMGGMLQSTVRMEFVLTENRMRGARGKRTAGS